MAKTPHNLTHSPIIDALPKACSDELAAVEFIEARRWGACPGCIFCGSTDVYKMVDSKTGQRNKRFRWRCHDCKKQFTVRQGTVFEESRIDLRHWCYAFWAMTASKKGVSALQIKRKTGLSYKSALFLLHRVRFAMTPNHATAPKLSGIIEADETYVGGKPRPQQGITKRKWSTTKTPVFAVLARGGDVRVRAMPVVNSANIKTALRETVDFNSRFMTDESNLYKWIGPSFTGGHEKVNHSVNEYARGDVTTNTVEGFFSILKRGLHGVYHAVSKEHLHRYLSEFEWRYNARGLNDGERAALAIQSAEGKRLRYREPKAAPKPAAGEQLPPFDC